MAGDLSTSQGVIIDRALNCFEEARQKPGTTLSKRKVRLDRFRIKGTKLAAAKLAALLILLAA